MDNKQIQERLQRMPLWLQEVNDQNKKLLNNKFAIKVRTFFEWIVGYTHPSMPKSPWLGSSQPLPEPMFRLFYLS